MVNIFRPSTWLSTRREQPVAESERSDAPGHDGAAMEEAVSAPSRPRRRTAPAAPPLRPVRERIEELAYKKWHQAGCPPGEDVRYWLEAEQEVLREVNDDGAK